MKILNRLLAAGAAMSIASIQASAAETWTFCAKEWGTCSFSGTAQVRYGANNKYFTKTFTGSTPCTNAVFGDPIYGVSKSCEYLTWTSCAKEWGTCSFSGTAQVRYGANNKYFTKTFTGSTPCTNAVFGDPIYGVVKSCEYLSAAAASAGTSGATAGATSGGTSGTTSNPPPTTAGTTAPPSTSSSTGTPPAATTTGTPWSACSRFQPGHYFRVVDDVTRKVDGLGTLRDMLSKDVSNFRGVGYLINWGMLEPSPGVYDFSRVDAALAQVTAKDKYLLLMFQDRTYWTGCNSNFIPTYVPREQQYNSTSVCYAKLWEASTMDHEIRVLQQLALRYKNDPRFLGFSMSETSIAPASVRSNPSLASAYYDQIKRMARSVHSVAPNLIINQYVNWPIYDGINALYGIADNLQAMGGGGGIGWPDSLPQQKATHTWYQIGRERNTKMLVIPGVEASALGSSLAETEEVYDMLVNDIKAHMIIWDIWHQDVPSYFTARVIPTVNNHKGLVNNRTCPF
jgi:hypothetical protein